jgi:hypothetical protein
MRAAQKEVERLKAQLAKGSPPHVAYISRASSPVRPLLPPQAEGVDQQQHFLEEQQRQAREFQLQQQQGKLEGALRQAMADYQMLLKGKQLFSECVTCCLYR